MSISIGLVGLPNAGKSTLFNALLKRQVSPEAKYPFTTIKPFTGVVRVPDPILEKLAAIVKPLIVVPATVSVIDIAGLVKNAYTGEGLGNEFLGHIRDVDAVIHVVRVFDDADIVHIMGTIDPDRDREIILTELEHANIHKPMVEFVNRDISDFDRVGDLIRACYTILGHITFYTIKGGRELHAWSVTSGATAPEAAGKVHSDFARKFIKAEVIDAGALIEIGSWKSAKDRGRIRLEGREYVVKDEDVIEFKFGQ